MAPDDPPAVLPPSHEAERRDMDELRAENDALRKRVTHLEGRLDELDSEVDGEAEPEEDDAEDDDDLGGYL